MARAWPQLSRTSAVFLSLQDCPSSSLPPTGTSRTPSLLTPYSIHSPLTWRSPNSSWTKSCLPETLHLSHTVTSSCLLLRPVDPPRQLIRIPREAFRTPRAQATSQSTYSHISRRGQAPGFVNLQVGRGDRPSSSAHRISHQLGYKLDPFHFLVGVLLHSP